MVTLPEAGKEPKEHQLKKLQLQEIGKLETENRYLRLLKENFELKLELEKLREKAQKKFPQVKPQIEPQQVKVAEIKEAEKLGDKKLDKVKDNK